MRRDRLSSILPAVFVCSLFGLASCAGTASTAGLGDAAVGEVRRVTVEAAGFEGSEVEAVGNFAYAPAAVERALDRTELAPLSHTQPDDDTHVYRLLTVRGEPGLLIVERMKEGARARARVGHFGAPAVEKKLLEVFARRFYRLRTGEPAP